MSRPHIIAIFVINIHSFNDYFAAAVRGASRITTSSRIIITAIRIVGIIVLLRSLLLSLCHFLLSLRLSFCFCLIYIINTSLITTNLFIDLINEQIRILFGIFKNKLLIIFIRNIIKKTIETINMLLERVSIFSRIYIIINMVSYRSIPLIILSITTVLNNGIVFIKQLRPIRGSAICILKTVIRDFFIQNLFIILSIFNGIKTLLKSY